MEGPPRGDVDRLCSAAARGDHEEVKKLLDSGVDPNGTNAFGRTPLQAISTCKGPIRKTANGCHNTCRSRLQVADVAELRPKRDAGPAAASPGCSPGSPRRWLPAVLGAAADAVSPRR
ncbi:cyclin-dependent kinase 4 inhibitor B isoform X3 [Parus major]|uniref:cyclin-dependent kinase 4 inhibitor B isoform X3 n=1 Tax=Parus major TaxID=9157 RepID=UPI00077162FE|nr:cyclin-dependent kinase 4 inhibitor B isoform X3 [Parus major]